MDMQNIIIWLGLIVIVVIVWDGLRRMKTTRVKPAKHEKQEPYMDPEEAARQAQIARELPNGGARIREMTENEKEEISSRLNLRERVPMLMERVEVQPPEDSSPEAETGAVQSELDFSAAMPQQTPKAAENPDERAQTELLDEDQDVSVQIENTDTAEADETNETADFEPVSEEIMPETPESEVAEPTDDTISNEQAVTKEDVEPIPDPGPVEDLVIVHVMAHKDEELSGSSVLDLLITAGLRHGPMDIFHYRNPKGVTEFSLANCVQPGTFDPDAMNQVNTPGVTLFMQLPTAADAMEAFDHLYEMAKFLATHLEAEILDEDHSTVTPQRIEYYREKIRSFERSKLIPS